LGIIREYVGVVEAELVDVVVLDDAVIEQAETVEQDLVVTVLVVLPCESTR
jgi:hypothetical protein